MVKRIALAAALLLLMAAAQAEQKYSDLSFLVLKAENGKPIRNASVVLHPVDKDGHQSSGGFQLKTDPDGQAKFPGAPFGKLRVQVLARGFQTYGEDFEINEPDQHITVKLKRPQRQYSIYDTPKPGDNKPDEKKPDEKPKR